MGSAVTKNLAFGLFFFAMIGLGARGVAADGAILAPAVRQAYVPGDSLRVEWTSDLAPTMRQPTVVYLLGPKFKRIRIGSVTRGERSGMYSLTWKIPADFLIRGNRATALGFKVEIRTGNGLRNRMLSRGELIRIQKEVQDVPSKGVNGTPDGLGQGTVPSDSKLTDKDQLVARYEFKGLYEAWVVKKLTVVNDSGNDGFDPDPNETTDAVEKVSIRYPDASGVLRVVSVPYTNGRAAFSGLDFYIPSRGSATLELYVLPIDPKANGGQFSGKVYRMGIQDSSNGASTFEAVGQVSGATVNTPNSLQFSGSSIGESVVRNGVLDFKVANGEPRQLLNGENEVFEFTVSSQSAALGRLVFDVYQNGLTTLDGARLYRNGVPLSIGDASQLGDAYLMWDSGPGSCFAHSVQSGIGTGMDCNGGTALSSKLIVAFSREEIVSGSTTFKLGFNVGGASVGDAVTVRLDTGDDFAKPVVAGTDNLNAKIHNGGADPELFANATDFASEATSILNRNIIWSDRSADLHAYPNLSPAMLPVTGSNGSADWTNGYLLGLNGLPSMTSRR
jgi:hypothetical protein